MLSTTALVAALSIVPMGAAFSQDAAVRGKITQIFDGRVLLQTEDGAVLVELPDGVEGDSLEPGQRIAVEGDRTGSDMVATVLRLQSESNGVEHSAGDTREASDTPDLPDALAGLDLRDLRIERDDDETKYRARLDGDIKFEAEYDRAGRLREVKTEPKGTLPAGLIKRLLSDDIRDAITDLGIARLHEIEVKSDQIEVKGHDDNDRPAEAEFAPSGLLLEFERKAHGGKRKGPPMQLGRDALRDIARDAGYTDIGRIKVKGNHADLHAINPDDEPVRLRVDAAGQITREERR
jgi:hypothetical protein